MVALLLECWTEKPGMILTQAQSLMQHSFFSPASAFNADSHTMSRQPQCAVSCISIYAYIRNVCVSVCVCVCVCVCVLVFVGHDEKDAE